ncbi:HlyD family secretion protein [bacterium]|nr:HlyD family secretion protein [bacterium]MBU1884519.1 HlyD family secretion protein [bacterium]
MNFNNKISRLLRYGITFFVVGVAVFLGLMLWQNYMNSSWTRDGRVRADIVMVSPDVSGLVNDVVVVDNQLVKQGDLLFKIDVERFEHALDEAESIARTKKAEYEMKKSQYSRRAAISDDAVSIEERDDARLEADIAKAKYEESLTKVQTAKLNLERAYVRAPSDGWISNLLLRKGDYVKAGDNSIAIVNSDSFWVYGYFEEHKLSLIHVGDVAQMKMLGSKYTLTGHVESIARGISDRDNATGERLLANVNPTFTWVRLAQRIPVRIHIDSIPEGLTITAGMTCSVSIKSTHSK